LVKIAQGQANTVVVTASERKTIESPYWLLAFTSEVTNETNTCICANTSGYIDRYDKFTVTESGTEDRVNGTLSLKPEGIWTLKVYEQSSSSNLDPANATLCHTEKVKVIGKTQQYTSDDTYTTGSIRVKVWNGSTVEG